MGLKLTTKGVDETSVLMPEDADKHTRYRIGKFTDWLDERGNSWLEPDLTAYRDDLLAQDYAPATVSAHLSTVRGQYERLLRDNQVRDSLEIAVRDGLEAQGGNYGPADVEALVNRAVIRLQNAIDPANSPVRMKVKQDHRTLIPPEKVTSALLWLQKRNRSANAQNWLKAVCNGTNLDYEATFRAHPRRSGVWKRKLLFKRKMGVFNVL